MADPKVQQGDLPCTQQLAYSLFLLLGCHRGNMCLAEIGPVRTRGVPWVIKGRNICSQRPSPHLRKPPQHGLFSQQRLGFRGVLDDLSEVSRLAVGRRQAHQPAVRAQKDVEQRQDAWVFDPLEKSNLCARRVLYNILL